MAVVLHFFQRFFCPVRKGLLVRFLAGLVFFEMAVLSAQVFTDVWPFPSTAKETAPKREKDFSLNQTDHLLHALPAEDFFSETVLINGQPILLQTRIVRGITLDQAEHLLAEKFPACKRIRMKKSLLMQQISETREIRTLSLLKLSGIPDLILFTTEQPSLSAQDNEIPQEKASLFYIPSGATQKTFMEYPNRNAQVISFQIP